MCSIDSEQTKLEEHLVRLSHFAIDDPDKQLKETAMKLFAVIFFNFVSLQKTFEVNFFYLVN